ncbi:serine hydrolase [Sphingobacterium sp. DR205]|uniref:serine hydrolase n=1 Tax=Sphingobacterium sp. DR205 TaxID=2713573 RepID=UPI0013E4F3B2|nr:serine hydrolase [Sphingobacterium sp. DR205]QIH35855.1 serine hydrolase [Sphingobacterium sp. DR205]
MSKILLSFTLLFLSLCSFGQKRSTDRKLEKQIKQLIQGFQGEVGIYVHNLKKHKEVNIGADSIFPTASVVKIPILVGVFDKIEKGQLQLDQELIYRESQKYGGSGLMQFFKDSSKVDLKTLVALMLSYSDNVTSIWNQKLAGGGMAINTLMADLQLQHTRVNSQTEGRKTDWEKYGWGQTTPKEMADLLTLIRQGKVISEKSSDRMYRFLGNMFYDERGLSQIPATVKAASKTGSLDDVRNEVMLVNAPKGDYVFSIFTKNNEDQSWGKTNAAEVLTRKLSKLLWDYYNK